MRARLLVAGGGGGVRAEGINSTNTGAPAPAAPVSSPPPAAGGAAFARILSQRMRGAHLDVGQEIGRVRAEIAAIRSGALLRPHDTVRSTVAGTAIGDNTGSAASKLAALPLPAQAGEDPHGWRLMSREVGDAIVGPGFGALFERQIDQESGFAPDVVFGLRRSSAGAEGIAQLMPQYYPDVDRTDPQQALLAGARTMRHYLGAHDGDLRKALASYNAGLGRVQSLVRAHGDGWERGLPAETRQYLGAILGDARPHVALGPQQVAVFGGTGPGGVLTAPLDAVRSETLSPDGARLLSGAAGAPVHVPSDGRVVSVWPASRVDASIAEGLLGVTLDHGGGWRTALAGLASVDVAAGELLRRGDSLGTLGDAGEGDGLLRLALALDGRALDPARYMIGGTG